MNQSQFIYITNHKHRLYGIGAFRICFKTNAGYTVNFAGDYYQVGLNEAKELPEDKE